MKLGWVENVITNSIYFDLKWVYTDCNEDYRLLNEG